MSSSKFSIQPVIWLNHDSIILKHACQSSKPNFSPKTKYHSYLIVKTKAEVSDH